VSTARAELLEDGGKAAQSTEFFRSPQFLDAERVTHTLQVETDNHQLLAPLIVREIPGTNAHDAVSPYGYPGLTDGRRGGVFRSLPAVTPEGTPPSPSAINPPVTPEGTPPIPPPINPEEIDWTPTGLISIFLRHNLAPAPLANASERNVVQIADPELPPKSRPSDRRQVRRNLEAGYKLDLVPGSETTPQQRSAFLDAYEQTMRRTEAAPHYFFGAGYFDRILGAERTWLALAHAPDGTLAAASIAVVSDGYLHYYLSGSADAHLRAAPMKNVVARLVEHAAELGLPLNLGGGLAPGDALEEFKRGFANRRQAWLTSELICDERRYAELSAGREAGGYFPAYRA
jgi:Acetyltransferase (GNAT) domain